MVDANRNDPLVRHRLFFNKAEKMSFYLQDEPFQNTLLESHKILIRIPAPGSRQGEVYE